MSLPCPRTFVYVPRGAAVGRLLGPPGHGGRKCQHSTHNHDRSRRQPSRCPGPGPRDAERVAVTPAPKPQGARPRPPAADTRTGRGCGAVPSPPRAPWRQPRPSCAKGPSGPGGAPGVGPPGWGPRGGVPGAARERAWLSGLGAPGDVGAPPAAREPPHVGPHGLAALVPDWPPRSQSEGAVESGSADWPQPPASGGGGAPFCSLLLAPRAPPPQARSPGLGRRWEPGAGSWAGGRSDRTGLSRPPAPPHGAHTREGGRPGPLRAASAVPPAPDPCPPAPQD